MQNIMLKFAAQGRFREGLDWAVFSLGALSLALAIAGTVLTKADIISLGDRAQTHSEVSTG